MKKLYNAIRIYFLSRTLISTLRERFPNANYTIWVNHWMDDTFQIRCVSGYEDDKKGQMIREYKWYDGKITYEEKLTEPYLDWFRNKHNLHIVLHPVKNEEENKICWNIIITDLAWKGYLEEAYRENLIVVASSRQYHDTYEEALSAAGGMAMGIVTEREHNK